MPLVCARVIWCLLPIRVVQSAVPRAAFWFVLWVLAAPISLVAAEEIYTVKRGDTLFGIAQRYGVPTATLAERNGLGRNSYVYTGQRLRIPGKAGARPAAPAGKASERKIPRTALPRSVQRAIDKAPVQPGRWKCIVIHHSGTDTGTVKAMDKYHREVRHMENGLAYDFVIGNGSGMGDGAIAVGQRWVKQLDGGHLASEAQNKIAIGICLVGNFDQHPPTQREMESLRALVEALMARCRLTPAAVKTHQQINVIPTRCPGSRFPTRSFFESLKAPGR